MGENRVADTVDAAAHERGNEREIEGGKTETQRAKSTEDEEVRGERPEKEETGQECMDECVVLRATQPRRLSCERQWKRGRESERALIRISAPF